MQTYPSLRSWPSLRCTQSVACQEIYPRDLNLRHVFIKPRPDSCKTSIYFNCLILHITLEVINSLAANRFCVV